MYGTIASHDIWQTVLVLAGQSVSRSHLEILCVLGILFVEISDTLHTWYLISDLFRTRSL